MKTEKAEYEYFSKQWNIWKPVLASDCVESLKKYCYQIRVKPDNR